MAEKKCFRCRKVFQQVQHDDNYCPSCKLQNKKTIGFGGIRIPVKWFYLFLAIFIPVSLIMQCIGK
jgi:RNA polymerase subunit RPABC4/transcription elongation factor Spt4